MSFTYSSTNLSTDLAKVRRLINDCSSGDMQFTDEELDFVIDDAANPYLAAQSACYMQAAKFAGQADKKVGKLSISLSQKSAQWKTQGDKLGTQGKSKGAPQLFAGGISVADKDTRELDTDRTPSDFYRDQFTIEPSS